MMMKMKMKKQPSMHLVFLLLDTLPYLTLPDLHMSFDSYDDASFRLQCQLIRYLSLGQLRVRLNKYGHIRTSSLPCTSNSRRHIEECIR